MDGRERGGEVCIYLSRLGRLEPLFRRSRGLFVLALTF